jgi:hypothetical protein
LTLFNDLFALIAFWALVGAVAAYYLLRRKGEAWALFGSLVGTIASAATVVASIGNAGQLDAPLLAPA